MLGRCVKSCRQHLKNPAHILMVESYLTVKSSWLHDKCTPRIVEQLQNCQKMKSIISNWHTHIKIILDSTIWQNYYIYILVLDMFDTYYKPRKWLIVCIGMILSTDMFYLTMKLPTGMLPSAAYIVI